MNPFAIFFRFGRIGRLGRRKGNQPGGPQRQEKTNVGLFVIEMAAERVPKNAPRSRALLPLVASSDITGE